MYYGTILLRIGANLEPRVPVNLSIKNAPDDIVTRLRERAVRHRRSLRGELEEIRDDRTGSRRHHQARHDGARSSRCGTAT
jgi:hypothetical protein